MKLHAEAVWNDAVNFYKKHPLAWNSELRYCSKLKLAPTCIRNDSVKSDFIPKPAFQVFTLYMIESLQRLNRITEVDTFTQGLNLQESNLSHSNLSGLNLKQANLERATLAKVNLNKANLEGATLNSANLNQADFSNADLQAVILANASGQRINFSGANLGNASLNFFNVRNSIEDIRLTPKTGANFTGANLSGVQAMGANLDHSIMDASAYHQLYSLSEHAMLPPSLNHIQLNCSA
jgi:hypothetical protein